MLVLAAVMQEGGLHSAMQEGGLHSAARSSILSQMCAQSGVVGSMSGMAMKEAILDLDSQSCSCETVEPSESYQASESQDSQVCTKALKDSTDERTILNNMHKTNKQVDEACLKQSFLLMKKEFEKCGKCHTEFVAHVSDAHRRLGNVEHVPLEMHKKQSNMEARVKSLRDITKALQEKKQSNMEAQIKSLQDITKALQTDLSITNGITTDLSKMVHQIRSELDILKLERQDVPKVRSDFDILELEGHDVRSDETSDLQNEVRSLIGRVQVLENSFDAIRVVSLLKVTPKVLWRTPRLCPGLRRGAAKQQPVYKC